MEQNQEELAELILVRGKHGGELIVAGNELAQKLIDRHGTSPSDHNWKLDGTPPVKDGFYIFKGKVKEDRTFVGKIMWASWREVRRLMPDAFA